MFADIAPTFLLFKESSSAARFGDLSPFGLLFEPFGDQYFALVTWQFGYFLGYFWKNLKKNGLNWFLALFLEL